jgi:hypothetical protein
MPRHRKLFIYFKGRSLPFLNELFSGLWLTLKNSSPRPADIKCLVSKVGRPPTRPPFLVLTGTLRALLTSELSAIFASAPPAPAASTAAPVGVRAAYARATGTAGASDGDGAGDDGAAKRREPGPEDDCPVCYEHLAGTAQLAWCATCGNALHRECFAQCACCSHAARKVLTADARRGGCDWRPGRDVRILSEPVGGPRGGRRGRGRRALGRLREPRGRCRAQPRARLEQLFVDRSPEASLTLMGGYRLQWASPRRAILPKVLVAVPRARPSELHLRFLQLVDPPGHTVRLMAHCIIYKEYNEQRIPRNKDRV